MSGAEALARVLDPIAFMHREEWDRTLTGQYQRESRQSKARKAAERILADPGPLLEALAEAGVLHRQSRRLQRGGPREVRYATVEPDGRRDGGDGLATEWSPDARP